VLRRGDVLTDRETGVLAAIGADRRTSISTYLVTRGIIPRMLPPFDQHGNLPAGIHLASMDSLVERFGSGSPEREVEIRELLEFIDWASTHGVRRIIVNGSFVTRKRRPNDVDLVVLPDTGTARENAFIDMKPSVWPFLQILIAADDEDLERWATRDFGTDRAGRGKGVVEVLL
jgi:hypothetical protein